MQPKALGILGMRRSGTSSVCIGLNELGVSFAKEEQLFSGDEFNQDGYWEHKALGGILRRLRSSVALRSLDCDPLPTNWLDYPASEYLVTQGSQVLQKYFLNLATPWAWKDPDASLSVPFVVECHGRLSVPLHFLICVRHPAEVVQSERRRSGIPEMETIGAWLAHTLVALQDSRRMGRTVIHYEDYLKDPTKALGPTVDALGLKPTDMNWQSATSKVRSVLAHHRARPGDLASYPALVQRVYDLAVRATAGFDIALETEIDECRMEFDAWRMMLGRRSIDFAQGGAQWVRGGNAEQAEFRYRLGEGWQHITIETRALPSSPVALHLFPLPGNIWLRNARWRTDTQDIEATFEPGRAGNLRNQFGLSLVSVLHGVDQVMVRTPGVKGPFTLEFDILAHSGDLITAETFKHLSEICLQR